MAAAKKTLNKNAAENKFFAKVYDSMKDFADVAVPFWSGAQMSNAKLGMAHAATLKQSLSKDYNKADHSIDPLYFFKIKRSQCL